MRPLRSSLLPLIAVTIACLLVGCGSKDEGVDTSGTGGTERTTTTAPHPTPCRQPGADPDAPVTTVDSEVLPDPGGIGGCSTPPSGPGGCDPAACPDVPVSTVVPPGDPTPPVDPSPTPVANRSDLVDPKLSAPDRVLIDPDDDRLVHVRFWGGVESCYGAHATAVERTAVVEVELLTGRRKDAMGKACIELAQYQEVDVRLSAPLGDRKLVPMTPDVNQPTAGD